MPFLKLRIPNHVHFRSIHSILNYPAPPTPPHPKKIKKEKRKKEEEKNKKNCIYTIILVHICKKYVKFLRIANPEFRDISETSKMINVPKFKDTI